jgi:NTE family protein
MTLGPEHPSTGSVTPNAMGSDHSSRTAIDAPPQPPPAEERVLHLPSPSPLLSRTGQRRLPLRLGLQGGGAHGAYTWGVLDALLEAGRFDLDAISGTSAGAMNAVVLAQGWTAALQAGRSPEDGARAALQAFWHAVAKQAPVDWGGTHGDAAEPALSPATRLMLQWSQMMSLSPYQLNPLARNPLRDLLAAQVDFELLDAACPIALHLAATHANTGRLKLFGNLAARQSAAAPADHGCLCVDAAMASACLPTLQPAVLVDGQPYWDGGYSANPALLPLVQGAGGCDVLIVMLAPLAWGDTPTTAAGIRTRAIEFAFNAPFVREAQLLAALKPAPSGAAHGWLVKVARALLPLSVPVGSPRWHLIDAELGHLPSETKLIARRDFLDHLCELGRARAQAWLAHDAAQVGRLSSVDLGQLLA